MAILREKVDFRKILVELHYCREHHIPAKFNLPKSKRAEAAEREEKQRQADEAEARARL